MATSLFKLVAPSGAVYEIQDNAGAIEVLVDGIKVVSEQQTAIASLTDNSGGTANDTLAVVEAAYTQATIANNFADLAAKTNAILTALRNHGIIAT